MDNNIEKLKEKLVKDPASKLFVPLAEEYKKGGQPDKAIEVLQAGLKNQPGYMSARVALGKIFLEKGMQAEAKEEFQKVVGAIPDNLFAQRKLADIYREVGDAEKAKAGYKTVLRLNPLDEEARAILEGYERPAPEETAFEKEVFKAPKEEEGFPGAEEAFKPVEEPAVSFESFEEAFGEELFGEKAPEEELNLEDVPSLEEILKEEVHGGEPEAAPEIKPEEIPSLEEISFESALKEKAPSFEDELLFGEAKLDEEEAMPVEEAEELLKELSQAEVEEVFAPLPFLELGERAIPQAGPDLGKADSYVERGDYYMAMQTYRMLLKEDPANRAAVQRLLELKSLLKLLGKDKELLIAKLEAFIEGIMKRRDEFFGSA